MTPQVERLTIEKTELERKVDIASREEIALATRIEEMQAECDFAREQLVAVKRKSGRWIDAWEAKKKKRVKAKQKTY